MRTLLTCFISALIIASCTGITMIGRPKDLYSPVFLKNIEDVKTTFRQGDSDGALKTLKAMNEEQLGKAEKAQRRNLIGVILFGKGDYEQALFNFGEALAEADEDPALVAQIHLNMASAHYKMGHADIALDILKKAKHDALMPEEAKRLLQLRYKLARELGRDQEALDTLFFLSADKVSLAEVKGDQDFEALTAMFFKLDKKEKYRTLESFQETKSVAIAYLAYLEAEKSYYEGDKDASDDVLSWLEKHFSGQAEIAPLVMNFRFRMENLSKMNPHAIGVVLPLSGEKRIFGERAMLGLDHALRSKGATESSVIIVKDSEGSGAVGAHRVSELIERDQVAVVIGGLFPNEAEKEYLEARRRGVLFISLSQIYLPTEQKNHLLIEIPGSVESQVSQLFTAPMLQRFGRRAALIYPKGARGESYVEEFWRRARLTGVEVTGVGAYDETQTDFRDLTKQLLGLQYPRERQEEFDFLKTIFDLEDNRSARRLQVLTPQIDFDWVFIPSLPREALQIIPSFGYFDAFNLKVIGGANWRSSAISDESSKLGELFFIGDDVAEASEDFTLKFFNRYKRKPRLLEVLGHDAFDVARTLLSDPKIEERQELDQKIRKISSLTSASGSWSLNGGLWLKKMASIRIKSGRFENLFSSVPASSVQEDQ